MGYYSLKGLKKRQEAWKEAKAAVREENEGRAEYRQRLARQGDVDDMILDKVSTMKYWVILLCLFPVCFIPFTVVLGGESSVEFLVFMCCLLVFYVLKCVIKNKIKREQYEEELKIMNKEGIYKWRR